MAVAPRPFLDRAGRFADWLSIPREDGAGRRQVAKALAPRPVVQRLLRISAASMYQRCPKRAHDRAVFGKSDIIAAGCSATNCGCGWRPGPDVDAASASNQRQALLGDTFLSQVVLEDLMKILPSGDPSVLTGLRVMFESNAQLNYVGRHQLRLDQFLLGELWPAVDIGGESIEAPRWGRGSWAAVPEKTFADSVEAIIGCVKAQHGRKKARSFVHAVIFRPLLRRVRRQLVLLLSESQHATAAAPSEVVEPMPSVAGRALSTFHPDLGSGPLQNRAQRPSTPSPAAAAGAAAGLDIADVGRAASAGVEAAEAAAAAAAAATGQATAARSGSEARHGSSSALRDALCLGYAVNAPQVALLSQTFRAMCSGPLAPSEDVDRRVDPSTGVSSACEEDEDLEVLRSELWQTAAAAMELDSALPRAHDAAVRAFGAPLLLRHRLLDAEGRVVSPHPPGHGGGSERSRNSSEAKRTAELLQVEVWTPDATTCLATTVGPVPAGESASDLDAEGTVALVDVAAGGGGGGARSVIGPESLSQIQRRLSPPSITSGARILPCAKVLRLSAASRALGRLRRDMPDKLGPQPQWAAAAQAALDAGVDLTKAPLPEELDLGNLGSGGSGEDGSSWPDDAEVLDLQTPVSCLAGSANGLPAQSRAGRVVSRCLPGRIVGPLPRRRPTHALRARKSARSQVRGRTQAGLAAGDAAGAEARQRQAVDTALHGPLPAKKVAILDKFYRKRLKKTLRSLYYTYKMAFPSAAGPVIRVLGEPPSTQDANEAQPVGWRLEEADVSSTATAKHVEHFHRLMELNRRKGVLPADDGSGEGELAPACVSAGSEAAVARAALIVEPVYVEVLTHTQPAMLLGSSSGPSRYEALFAACRQALRRCNAIR